MIVISLLHILKNKLTTFYSSRFLGIKCDSNVTFKGIPFTLKKNNAKISIGKNTIINSSNYGYHINMFSKCKLYADVEWSLIEIGENCRIHGTCIHAFNKISIGNNCLIAANTQIIDANGHENCMDNPSDRLIKKDKGKEIIIENNVWIAANCVILGGTIIGEGSIITAGSVVKGIIPKKSIYGGNPGKLIKNYNENSYTS